MKPVDNSAATTVENRAFYWRKNLVNRLANWSAAIALLTVAAASYNAYLYQDYLLIGAYLILYALTLSVAFIPKLAYELQAKGLIFIVFATGLVTYLAYGRGSIGAVYFLVFAFVTTLFYGWKAGMAALALAFITILGLAVAFQNRWIPFYREVDSSHLPGWLPNGFAIVLLGGLLVLATEYVISNLVNLLNKSYQLAQDLDASRALLEKRVEERTGSLEEARKEAVVT